MGEESGLVLTNSIKPVPRLEWLTPQSFELLHRPCNEMLVDALRKGVELRAVEVDFGHGSCRVGERVQ